MAISELLQHNIINFNVDKQQPARAGDRDLIEYKNYKLINKALHLKK